MRIAAIYDVHGNLPALEAVLEEVEEAGVDEIVVGGDVIPGPMPVAALSRLLELALPTAFLRGNGERAVLATRAGSPPSALPASVVEVVRWVAAELPAELARALDGWPLTLRRTVPGIGAVLFCHATPRDDNEIFTEITPEEPLRALIDPLDVDLVVCGHTHIQFDRTVGTTRVVNAGSVGMPFEEPGAYWLLLGPDVELRRTEYDLEAAARRIRRSGYPEAERFAAHNVLRTPNAEEMRARLEAAALRSV